MQKVIKITKDVLAVGIFLGMSYFLIKRLMWGFGFYPLEFTQYTLFTILSIAITGLSMLYALKKLL